MLFDIDHRLKPIADADIMVITVPGKKLTKPQDRDR